MLPVNYSLITYSSYFGHQNAEKTPSKGCSVQRTPSLADSMAEYYDARDVIVCENSSENGEDESDESGLSDITTTSNSEPDEVHGEPPLFGYHCSAVVLEVE